MSSMFITTKSNNLINQVLLQDVILNPMDDTELLFRMRNGEFLVEKYNSSSLAKARLEQITKKLTENSKASDVTYEDNLGYGVNNVQSALDEAFNALDNKPEYSDLENLVSYNKQNKNDTQKTTARNNILAKRDIIDLGIIDFADYDNDFDIFMNTLLNEGEYKFSDTDFTYYVKVVNLGVIIGQEYCSSEESYTAQYFRTVYLDDAGNFDYATVWDSVMTFDLANNTFAQKSHVHYKILNTASSIRTYLDSFNQYGEFSITSTADKEKYWVFTDYYNVIVNGKSEYRRIQRYYSLSEPWKIYSRFRTI